MSYKLITQYDSLNYWPRSRYGHNGPPTGITIHHWGERGQLFQNVVDYLCRPGGNTSAHVVVEDGKVAWIIDAAFAAFHSGSTIGNGTTIGIECRPEATAGDYRTVAELIRDIRAEYGDLPLYPHRYWQATACPGVWDLEKLDRMAREVPTNASTAIPTTIEGFTNMTPEQATEALRLLRDIHRNISGEDQKKTARVFADVLLDTDIPIRGAKSSGNKSSKLRDQFSWLEHNIGTGPK